MKGLVAPAFGIVLALSAEGTAAEPTGTSEILARSLNEKLKITPEAPDSVCTVLHFISDSRLLASHRPGGPGIWDATTGRLERRLINIAGPIPRSVAIHSKGKTDQEGVPRYHCATESLLIYFLETGPRTKGMALSVWDLETLPESSARTFLLRGHSPKSFWRMYDTQVVRPEAPQYGPWKRVEVNGVLEDRYTEPAYRVYACLAVPQRNELHVLVPYSKKPLGDTTGMRLTVIDTEGALRENFHFDLPSMEIEGIALHPKRPILFCVTSDDRLLAIDTASKTIAKEVCLKNKVSSNRYVRLDPAISPDGRLLAIGNADGTISILECFE